MAQARVVPRPIWLLLACLATLASQQGLAEDVGPAKPATPKAAVKAAVEADSKQTPILVPVAAAAVKKKEPAAAAVAKHGAEGELKKSVPAVTVKEAGEANAVPATGDAPGKPQAKATNKMKVGLTGLEKRKEHIMLAAKRAKVILDELAANATAAESAAQVPMSPLLGLEGQALLSALAAAEKLQADRASTQENILAQEVEGAAAVHLISGDGDLSTTGKCRSEVEFFCPEVKPGEGHLAQCLNQQVGAEEAGLAGDAQQVSVACKAELDGFNVEEAGHINHNVNLARKCRGNIKKFCSGLPEDSLLPCLRSHSDDLKQMCYNEVFNVAVQQSGDYRLDPALFNACQADAAKLCPKVKTKGGRVQQCLRSKRLSLQWDCQEQLFRAEVDNADDIRLQTRLFNACLGDKKMFCADVEPGHSRAITCLEEHRSEPAFSAACAAEIEDLLIQRATDFRLDPSLRRDCKSDIIHTCGVELSLLDALPETEATVIHCLQDFRHELKSPACQQRVRHGMELASQDIRADVMLEHACHADRQKLCAEVQPGSANVIRCLKDRRSELSPECGATLFDEEVLMGESIDFQYPMKTACASELAQFCEGVRHEAGAGIRCLQEAQGEPAFGEGCRAEVAAHEARTSADFRLNFRLRAACEGITEALCPEVCGGPELDESSCGGAVLRCLTEKSAAINSTECLKEVEYFEKMEVRDFNNDVLLAEACRPDVERLCKTVERGEVHDCLREHRAELSAECAAEEGKLEEQQSVSVELQPGVSRDCAAERELHCAGVRQGQSRVYNCLIANARMVDFSGRCRRRLMRQQKERLGNWRLDYNLRTTCEPDVELYCQSALAEQTKRPGMVLQCLIDAIGDTHVSCAEETVRAVHGALQFFHLGLPVVMTCDNDAKKYCLKQLGDSGKKVKSIDVPVGEVADCLLEHLPALMADDEDPPADVGAQVGSRRLLQGGMPAGANQGHSTDPDNGLTGRAESTEESLGLAPAGRLQAPPLGELGAKCAALVALGDPSDVYAAYQSALGTSALAAQLKIVEKSLHIPVGTLVTANKPAEVNQAEVLTLTGWSALGAGASLVALSLGLALLGAQRWRSKYAGYQMMVKSPPGSIEMR